MASIPATALLGCSFHAERPFEPEHSNEHWALTCAGVPERRDDGTRIPVAERRQLFLARKGAS